MSSAHSVDIRTSPPASWKPQGLIVKRELWFSYNAAKVRVGKDGDDKDPLEWESTNLWEDLYHHYLLRGYCNNSQIAPHNTSARRCDIVTRYFEGDSRKTMLFTEVKRANKAEATKGIADTETQVLEYCRAYLAAKGSNKQVYACTAIGPFIRCFLVQSPTIGTGGSQRGQPVLFDLWDFLNGGGTMAADQVDVAKSRLEDYLDAGIDQDALKIKQCFQQIRKLGDPPFAASSRPPSATSTGSAHQTSGSPMSGSSVNVPIRSISRGPSETSSASLPAHQASGSPMSGISGNTGARSISREPSESPRRHQSASSTGSGHDRPGVQGSMVGVQTPQQHNSPRSTAESPQRGRRVLDPNSRNSESPGTPSNSKTYRHRTPPGQQE